jgi:hypothetical protein
MLLDEHPDELAPMIPFAAASRACLLAYFGLALTATVQSAESIRLRLASGRSLDGEVSPRTGDERLWLVQRVGNAELARPVEWQVIVAAEFRQQRLTGSQLRSIVLDPMLVATAAVLQQSESELDPVDPFQDDPLETEELPSPPDEAASEVADRLMPWRPIAVPAVASVRFDAHIANWDADVEADGLVVQVVPVDAYGQVVPVRGTLEVELFGVRHIAFQDAPRKRGRSYGRLGRWTQLLVPEYIHSDGGWFKLPFQAAQPEFDPRIGYKGLVHVTLVVPGAGVFEDSLDGIRLRPFAPLRDGLERDTGHRFFATEATGRGKRSW